MAMRPGRATSNEVLWGLWVFLTLAVLGFTNFLAGLVAGATPWTLTGAALIAIATVGYLGLHFWSTAHASLEPGATSAAGRAARADVRRHPAAPPARPENFDHLLSHTLERIVAEPPHVPGVAESSGRQRFEDVLVAGAPPGRAEAGRLHHTKRDFVPAAQRRAEWIDAFPIIRDVLASSPTAEAAPGPGHTRGQCSGCGTILWAPAQRPVRLRCPTCHRSAWLER